MASYKSIEQQLLDEAYADYGAQAPDQNPFLNAVPAMAKFAGAGAASKFGPEAMALAGGASEVAGTLLMEPFAREQRRKNEEYLLELKKERLKRLKRQQDLMNMRARKQAADKVVNDLRQQQLQAASMLA